MNEPLLRTTTEFWIPTQNVFQFNGVILWPTLEKFGAIMGEHNFDAIILPTLEEDLSNLSHQLLGVPLAMAKLWCKSNKLNVFMVFKYFLRRIFLWLGWSVPIISILFALAFLQGSSWCMKHLVWIQEFFTWLNI